MIGLLYPFLNGEFNRKDLFYKEKKTISVLQKQWKKKTHTHTKCFDYKTLGKKQYQNERQLLLVPIKSLPVFENSYFNLIISAYYFCCLSYFFLFVNKRKEVKRKRSIRLRNFEQWQQNIKVSVFKDSWIKRAPCISCALQWTVVDVIVL